MQPQLPIARAIHGVAQGTQGCSEGAQGRSEGMTERGNAFVAVAGVCYYLELCFPDYKAMRDCIRQSCSKLDWGL